jgi:hypothetical protein
MGLSWEGVLFIWVLLLWPMLLASFYLSWKKGVIKSKGKFFLASVAVGYAVVVATSFPVSSFIIYFFLDTNGISSKVAHAETTVDTLAVVAVATHFILPVFFTHYMSKRFS